MTPDDFLKSDPKKIAYHLDNGRIALTNISLAVENKWYLLSLMKNQIKIMELIKEGHIIEEKVNEIFTEKLDKLNEEIQKEIADKIAFISSKTT